jgi:hypothetical protein
MIVKADTFFSVMGYPRKSPALPPQLLARANDAI